MKYAKQQKYEQAIKSLEAARAAHDKRRYSRIRKGLNPTTDPTEEVFLHSVRELIVLMELNKKAKAAGYLPFDAPNWGLIPWYSASLAPLFMTKTVAHYATLSYHADFIPGVMTTEDWARAVTKLGYRPSKDAGFIAAYSTLKDWSQYFAPGWSTPNAGNPDQLFANGRLLFYWNGTWFAPQLKQQKLSFPYASFWFPAVTAATSPEAAAIPNRLGKGMDSYSEAAFPAR